VITPSVSDGPVPWRIVLVETSHPGNIGAAARAMKTMALDSLYLVRPKKFPHADATAMASGADDLLTQAHRVESLEEAVADCGLVLGTSARLRTLRWPQMGPRQAAERAVQESDQHPVALVFGRERTGLTNEELALCHALVHVPANPHYSSLNLAMSVQILSYELMRARQVESTDRSGREAELRTGSDDLARSEEMEYFYTHLRQVMIDTGFLDPQVPKHLMRRLRRLFGRARVERQELNILRGILAAVDKYGDKSN